MTDTKPETLTTDERAKLHAWYIPGSGYVLGHKVASLIDVHQADREALVEQAVQFERERSEARARADAAEQASACHRAAWESTDERCKAAESEAAALRAEVERLKAARDGASRDAETELSARNAAETKLAVANAEVERLRAELQSRPTREFVNASTRDFGEQLAAANAESAANERRARAFQAGATKLQSERDAANDLLEEIRARCVDCRAWHDRTHQLPPSLLVDVERILAGQTAAPTCTEAEQRVLGTTTDQPELEGERHAPAAPQTASEATPYKPHRSRPA